MDMPPIHSSRFAKVGFKIKATEHHRITPHRTIDSITLTLIIHYTTLKEYTTVTPYYSEDILLTRKDLEAKNSDGVSTLLYLQTLYKNDWLNFLERRRIHEDEAIWSAPHLQELRMWASLRAQTLFRTVEVCN
jgi:hypothetical protein